ncbi:MAG TPA: CAP domain-containing protein [Actinopolymorphaceae bacterium]
MSQGGPVRRPSPLAVLLVFLGACLAPVVMLLVTGLTGGPRTDRVRTADGGGGDERAGLEIVPDGEAESAPSTTTATAPEPVTPTPAETTAAPTTAAPPSTVVPTTAVAPAPPPPPAPTTTTRPPAASPADRVVELVNAARAEAGCGPLATDERLARAAQGHADDMAAQGCFSHTSLDGRSFADRVRDAGHPRPGGENIAQGQRSAEEVHEAWMGSPAHRDNILNCDFTAIGVGVNTGAWTWVQDFGY